MLAKLTRAALAAAALSLPAFADSNDARVEYRYLGQGAFTIVTPAPAAAPYALTGQKDSSRQTVRVIDAGQGRITLTTSR